MHTQIYRSYILVFTFITRAIFLHLYLSLTGTFNAMFNKKLIVQNIVA